VAESHRKTTNEWLDFTAKYQKKKKKKKSSWATTYKTSCTPIKEILHYKQGRNQDFECGVMEFFFFYLKVGRPIMAILFVTIVAPTELI
jgi:hypothetical protein